MSIERITLEWRYVVGSLDEAGHLVLVARESGQTDGAGYAISGNASLYKTLDAWNYVSGSWGVLEINQGAGAGTALSDTVDAYPSGKTESQNNANDITEALIAAGNGKSLTEIWDMMCDFANQIGQQEYTYDPGPLLPVGVGTNSNSLIASVLSLAGLDIDQSVIGSLPSQGFPGSDTILTGSEDDYLRGFNGNDVFKSSGGGNDVLHGGDGTIIRDSLSDGRDTVLYYGYDAVTVKDEGTYWSVDKALDSEDYVDTLYSIESFGNKIFRLLNKVDFADSTSGKNFKDATDIQIDDATEIIGDGITTFVHVDIDGTDIEFFNFGSYAGTAYADRFDLNRLVGRSFEGGNGNDTVSYAGVGNHGIRAVLDGAGNGEILREGGVLVASLGGLDGIAPGRDAISSIERVIGTQRNDAFKLLDVAANLTIDADHQLTMGGFSGTTVIGNVEYALPSGNPYGYSFFTNRGYDTLDLSSVTDDLTVQIGGAVLENYNSVYGGDPSRVLVNLDGYTLTARGIEDVRLGAGDDLLTVGRAVNVSGTETLTTKIDMGGGNDTVLVWGDALLRDGQIYTRDGAVVSGFEKIDLTVISGSVSNYVPTFRTEELGHAYVKTAGTNTWLDYGGVDSGLTITLASTTGSVSDGTSADTLSGRFNVIGSDLGDTINAGANHGLVRLGSGTNQINLGGYSANGFYYGGGVDTYQAAIFNYHVGLMSDVALGDVTISHVGSTLLLDYGVVRQYGADVKVDIAGQGSITFTAALTWWLWPGSDNVYGTGDDFITNEELVANLTLLGSGQIDLLQTGAAQLLNNVGNPNAVPDYTAYDFNFDEVTGTSGADTLAANSFKDTTVNGGAGNDEITGGFGNDKLYGGDGHDYIRGGAGNDTIYGGAGNDILSGDAGNDTLIGGAGDDVMIGGAGPDTFHVEGNDRILDYSVHEGDAILGVGWLESGLTTLKSGQALILGHSGNALTLLNFFDSNANGGIGSDYIRMSLDTGDRMVRVNADGTVANISQGWTDGNDTLSGTSGDDVLFGFGGNDTLSGLAGDDHLFGGDGDDTLFGGDDNDVLVGGAGSDALYGGDGADLFVFNSGDVGNGVDTIHDFSLTEGDAIDLRDILSGYDPLTDDLADFVEFTNAGSNSELRVDLDGAGTVYGWTQIATINGHINLDAATMEANGLLLAA